MLYGMIDSLATIPMLNSYLPDLPNLVFDALERSSLSDHLLGYEHELLQCCSLSCVLADK